MVKDKKFDEQAIQVVVAYLFKASEKELRKITPKFVSLLNEVNYKIYSPYDFITEYVFNEKIDNADDISTGVPILQAAYLEDKEIDDDYVTDFFKSVIRHVKLAVVQYNHIAKQFDKAQSANEQLQLELKKREEEFIKIKSYSDDLEKQINDINVEKSSIYTDFISILGIFSALTFGLFGGFSTLGEFIQTISSGVSLSRATFLGTLLIIGLISLVFILLNGVSILADKQFKSCCNEQGNCNHPLRKKFPIFFYSMFVLCEVLIVSIVIIILNNKGIMYLHPLRSVGGMVLLALFLISALRFIPILLDKLDEYVLSKSSTD